MKTLISNMIDALPPLPKTMLELEKYNQLSDKEPLELFNIICKDPLLISILLKLSNSVLFGFKNKVETPRKAISLLGVNYTLSVALGYTMKKSLDTNLRAYGVSSNEFMERCSISSALLTKWFINTDIKLKEKLLLPVFLQEAGIFILSNLASKQGKTDNFNRTLQFNMNREEVEMEFFETTTSSTTAKIFRHWNLSENLINIIEFVDDLDNCPEEYKYEAQILKVIKIANNLMDPFHEDSVKDALQKAKEFSLDTISLEKAIIELQNKEL